MAAEGEAGGGDRWQDGQGRLRNGDDGNLDGDQYFLNFPDWIHRIANFVWCDV